MSDHGAAAEKLVEEICRTIFLADFTVRSPPYRKGSGVEKEAADVLVPFGDVLIAFQVKSKRSPANASTTDDTFLRRVEKTVSEGIGQLKTIKRAVKAGFINSLKNVVGIDIPFNPASVRKIVGIVVIDLPDQLNAPREAQISVFNGFGEQDEIPAHVFRSDELHILSEEIDTLPDFVDYLDVREALFKNKKIGPITSELDLLAFYKMHPEELKKYAHSPNMLLILEEGLWKAYRNTHKAAIKQRDADNEPSRLIDRTIEWLHTSIGFQALLDRQGQPAPTPSEEVRNYARIALELSRLPRVHRRVIGKKWLERMEKADTAGRSFSVSMSFPQEAILVMSSTEANRQIRAKMLYHFAALAYCHLKANKILGIMTESISAHQRSYDFVLMEGVRFENEAELCRQAAQLFGPRQHVTETEFRPVKKSDSE